MTNKKKSSDAVISEEPILYSYPELIKRLEYKRLNNRKRENSMMVYEEEMIRRMMSVPEGYGKPFLENLYKYNRSNKSSVLIDDAVEGEKLVIKKEDFL
ncbi:hypothetical protein [Oceanobacillus oncorhynchi]|uniref:hypothetical protein n=1 Tax=Oceanobacillus oncorhynchi TaxID=545501 RepID=UPI0034D6127B